jgi:hypothetical protein
VGPDRFDPGAAAALRRAWPGLRGLTCEFAAWSANEARSLPFLALSYPMGRPVADRMGAIVVAAAPVAAAKSGNAWQCQALAIVDGAFQPQLFCL